MKFIFATSNPNKVREVNKILNTEVCTLSSLREIGFEGDIEETGATLEENAWIKADHIYQNYHQNVLAEDTGLEVFSLNMAPGVYSARYAGEQRDDQANMNKLLSNLKRGADRRAQFRTVVALIKMCKV